MRFSEPVARFMTAAVVVLEADRPASEVLDCFAQYPFHHLPVVQRGRLVGMLSSADVLKVEFFLPKDGHDRARFIDEHVTIGRLMRSPAISVATNTSIGDAAERMMQAGVHALPVVDESGLLVGILTSSDIIQGLLHAAPHHGYSPPPAISAASESDEHCYRKPTDEEYAAAIAAAETMHFEQRDPRHIGQCLLYLAQRRDSLEKVLTLAERFLKTGLDEQVHALLLRAIYAASRLEEQASGAATEPYAFDRLAG